MSTNLVFARANDQEANTILGILKTYEVLSGQMVNFDKCEVSFSGGLSRDIRPYVSSVQGGLKS